MRRKPLTTEQKEKIVYGLCPKCGTKLAEGRIGKTAHDPIGGCHWYITNESLKIELKTA